MLTDDIIVANHCRLVGNGKSVVLELFVLLTEWSQQMSFMMGNEITTVMMQLLMYEMNQMNGVVRH